MHELSIAQALIDAACEAASDSQVTRIFVRIGALAGVVPEALLFSFEVAAEGTSCAGAELQIELVPLTIQCSQCNATKTLAELYTLLCPDCGTAASSILTGRELDFVCLELVEHDPAHC